MTLSAWGRTYHPLIVAALIGPPLAVVAPLGMAPLFIVVALFSLALAWRERPWQAIDRRIGLAAAALLVWCLVSASWSPDALQAVRTGAVLGAEALAGLSLVIVAGRLGDDARRRLTLAAAIGLVLALVMVVAETRIGLFIKPVQPNMDYDALVFMRGNRLSRGLVLATIFATPVILCLLSQGRKGMALTLSGVLLAAVLGTPTLAPKLALPVALAMAGVAFVRPRLAVRGWCAIVLLVILAMPAAALLPPPQEAYDRMPWLKGSSHHRLTIWRFTAINALDKPVFGWGLDGSRNIPGADDEILYYRGPHVSGYDITEAQLPLHPHNAALQWWLELGMGGTALVIAFLVAVLGAIGRRRRAAVVPAMAGFAAATVVAMVSFGIWQSWWQSGLWLIAALVAGMVPARGQDQG